MKPAARELDPLLCEKHGGLGGRCGARATDHARPTQLRSSEHRQAVDGRGHGLGVCGLRPSNARFQEARRNFP